MDRQALINQLLHIIHQLELQITAIRSVIHQLREHEDNSDDSDVILVDAKLVHLVHAQVQQQVRAEQEHSRQDPTPTRRPPTRRELREQARQRARLWAQRELSQRTLRSSTNRQQPSL